MRRSARRFRSRHPIGAFLVRRVATGVATLFVVSILIFLATSALPGDTAEVVLGKGATPSTVAALRHRLHQDSPIVTRYANWLGGAVTGDLGQSAVSLAQGASSAPVSKVVGTPLRNSLILVACTLLLLVPLSLAIGTFAAVRAGRAADYVISYTALALAAMPEFVFGTFLILVFFTQLGLLPPLALVAPGASPFARFDTLVLPIVTLLGAALALSARQIRAGVIQTRQQGFVAMARLGGLPERRVLTRYVLRNSLGPAIQALAQTVQYLFGGVIIVEALFNYPGIGRLLVEAVAVRDVTEVQSVALIFAAIYIAVNVLADLAVVLVVPRLRTALR